MGRGEKERRGKGVRRKTILWPSSCPLLYSLLQSFKASEICVERDERREVVIRV